MDSIQYINRQTGKTETEEVFGEQAIRFLYGNSFASKTLGKMALHGLAKWPFMSWVYGVVQSSKWSKAQVAPFIERFGLDTSEFLDPPDSYSSFNDFFVRKLKPEARPLSYNAVMPADARYKFYPEIRADDSIEVKGKTFCLRSVLQSEELAKRYEGGSVVMARLCPTDCHRFYFPFDCTPGPARLINGKLFSVNPIAIKDNPWIWGVNRRMLTICSSQEFGDVAYLEVGATNVGSIIQTYTPGAMQPKGSEKGFFEFGGSALIILFEKGRIKFDADLVAATKQDLEIRCLIGQPLGKPQS